MEVQAASQQFSHLLSSVRLTHEQQPDSLGCWVLLGSSLLITLLSQELKEAVGPAGSAASHECRCPNPGCRRNSLSSESGHRLVIKNMLGLICDPARFGLKFLCQAQRAMGASFAFIAQPIWLWLVSNQNHS